LLLDPQSNHNLDDWFIKRLLQRSLTTTGFALVSVTPIDLDVRDMSQIAVLREWQRIDILLLDEDHRLATIIKNKIGTGEHSDQLSRYHPPARTMLAGGWLGCA
jgi:hypothetical protein